MMTSMQRVLTALGHREPDKVPLFLLTTMHGAKEMGLSIREYYSRADYVVEGQMRLLAKYRSDCLVPFHYAGIECEAFGGDTVFYDDGPPNAGAPVIRRPDDIDRLEPPKVAGAASLGRVLEVTRQLKERVGDTVPIAGVAISPFSLPVMQMGFEPYIRLIYEQPERFARLMAVNQATLRGMGQCPAGGGRHGGRLFRSRFLANEYSRELYLKTGHRIAMETLPQIKGPAAIHLASGRGLAIVDDIAATGTAAVGVSTLEDLAEWKAAARGRFTVIGNLNGVEMRRSTPAQAENEVKRAIGKAGRGGGFILSDNHGEIPWQVPRRGAAGHSRCCRALGPLSAGLGGIAL